jgi:hypothetical protein
LWSQPVKAKRKQLIQVCVCVCVWSENNLHFRNFPFECLKPSLQFRKVSWEEVGCLSGVLRFGGLPLPDAWRSGGRTCGPPLRRADMGRGDERWRLASPKLIVRRRGLGRCEGNTDLVPVTSPEFSCQSSTQQGSALQLASFPPIAGCSFPNSRHTHL